MGWFRKKKGRGEAQLAASAQKIADAILAVQTRWAANLNAQAQKIGMRKTTILIGAMLIGFAFYFAWLMADAIM
jgi:hypothetical protein